MRKSQPLEERDFLLSKQCPCEKSESAVRKDGLGREYLQGHFIWGE